MFLHCLWSSRTHSLSAARKEGLPVCSDGHFISSHTGPWALGPEVSNHVSIPKGQPRLHCMGRGHLLIYFIIRFSLCEKGQFFTVDSIMFPVLYAFSEYMYYVHVLVTWRFLPLSWYCLLPCLIGAGTGHVGLALTKEIWVEGTVCSAWAIHNLACLLMLLWSCISVSWDHELRDVKQTSTRSETWILA